MKKVIDKLWGILKGFVQQKNLKLRLPIVIVAVIVMGFCLSWLVMVDWGTDPCTAMNLAISAKLGMTLGNWQALLNVILFIIVIIFGNNDIGFGTLANMFLVGYSCDFFSWVWSKVLPEGFIDPLPVKITVFVIALVLFIIAAAFYMDMKLGTAPYDAISFIIHDRLLPKVPFKFIRMAYDFLVCGIALLFDGKVGIVTIAVALFLGFVIEFLGKQISKLIEF